MPPSDAQLVHAARSGDREAFAALAVRHHPPLLRVCTRFDPVRGEDAAQEALLRAMLSLDRLARPESFGSWLIGIGLNVCRGPTRQTAPLLEELADPAPSPPEQAAAADLAGRVRDAIGSLPPGQREAVALFYLAGLTHAETASHLGTAVSAVKTRLHKARASLRPHLTDLKEHPMTAMHVTDVRRTADNRHVVFLAGDGRELPIWVGEPEALAMVLVLEKVEMPRPGPYHFAASLLDAAGRKVERVVVTKLVDQIFYALVHLDDGSAIDARPSDALTLALVAGAPIEVEPEVLAAADEEPPREHTADAKAIAEEARERQAALAAELSRPE